ncbi:MAG: hypothetical protein ABSF26_16475 [Thermoguttaceae bacterium]
MRDFLQGRIRLVRELIDSDIRISYGDLVLILTAVISACAAARWPGGRIDRCRFVELLVRHSLPDAHTTWVCVPALINSSLVAEADTPYGPGESTRIFRDDEIDLDLPAARARYQHVSPIRLKQCTYASLIYEWLRCGYAHEYCPHDNITPVPPSRHNARLSYIGRATSKGLKRMICFHLDYLIDLAQYHAINVAETPDPRPRQWWIDVP